MKTIALAATLGLLGAALSSRAGGAGPPTAAEGLAERAARALPSPRMPVDPSRRQLKLRASDEVPAEDVAALPESGRRGQEAPAGYDNRTNGFSPQGPEFSSLTSRNVVPLRSFNDNRFLFEEVETVADGLGPTYNAQSCRECHQNVVTGGASQVAEVRSGRLEKGRFFESLGGTLIQSRSVHPDVVEHSTDQDSMRTFRISTNTLGSGFVEAIANSTLAAISRRQPEAMRGKPVVVPVLEADNNPRIGRFGWKGQHASLESFAADAYLNEMGITTPLFPDENTSAGRYVGFGTEYDPLPEPEDDGVDSQAFADFMRATKVPPRGRITTEVRAGEATFERIGCATCHLPSIHTALPGTPINGGTLTVHPALGNKVIHPYSDFLLHDVDTGDGIPVLPTPEHAWTANRIRTAPLWGLGTRNRLMHDGLSLTIREAILRHGGQAARIVEEFKGLDEAEVSQLVAFLKSL